MNAVSCFVCIILGLLAGKIDSANGSAGLSLSAVTVDYVGQCKDVKGPLVFQALDLRLRLLRRNVFAFNGRVVIKEPISGKIWYMVGMVKCTVEDSPDTCETYSNLRLNRICEELHRDDRAFSAFYKSLTSFERHCPMQPGEYPVEQSMVDLEQLGMIPTSLGYWKLRVSLHNSTTLLKCVDIFLKIEPSRPSRRQRPLN